MWVSVPVSELVRGGVDALEAAVVLDDGHAVYRAHTPHARVPRRPLVHRAAVSWVQVVAATF